MIERGQTPHEEIWSYLQNKHQIKNAKGIKNLQRKVNQKIVIHLIIGT